MRASSESASDVQVGSRPEALDQCDRIAVGLVCFQPGCALTALSAAGALIEETTLTELAEIAGLNAPGGLSPIEAYAVHRKRLADHPDRFDPRVARRIAAGVSVSADRYNALLDNRRDWIARVEDALQGFDAVLCPTVPIIAPEIAALVADDDEFFKANGQLLRTPSPSTFSTAVRSACRARRRANCQSG